ncbi:SIMPL domain-containing protein [Candidatus Gracilibacteria bacterium]|nr:SIMPL domain-containing protein [Candidatus Gracilibacteria bacterium]
MNTSFSALIIGLAIIASAWIIGNNINHNSTITSGNQNMISVSGDGKVFATPDTFLLTIIAEEKTKTTREGFAQVGAKIATLKDLLLKNGIAEKDIQSINIAINPNYIYDNGKSTIDGFVATHGLAIKIRKLETVDEILTGVSTVAGVQIQGTSYDIDDKTELYKQARTLAIAKARAKAEDMAQASGITIGKVTSINENQSSPPILYQNQMMKVSSDGAGNAGGISAGQLEIMTTVSINYEIL